MMNDQSLLKSATRRNDIDAIRVLAFALLILYHVGMFYVADWGWHVKSAYTADWLKIPMLLVNQWRLPLLFLISGAVVHFLLDKVSPGRFAWLRTRRLLIPLIFGMLVIVPPQAWLQARDTGAFDGGYIEFLVRYFSFQPWPAGAFDGSDIGITWNHLWFLPYLLSYSLVLALLLPVISTGPVQALLSRIRALRGVWLLALPALPFVGIQWLLGDFRETHAFFNDPRAHATYGLVFLLGFAIGRDAGLWAELRRMRRIVLPLALTTYAILIFIRAFGPGVSWMLGPVGEALADALADVVVSFNGWFWLMAVLGWGAHGLNRPFRWLPYATEAVVSWYILHQTITVVLGAALTPYALGPVFEPVLVLGGTIFGCLLIHEFVVRRVGWLRPLFGLKRVERRPGVGTRSAGMSEAGR